MQPMKNFLLLFGVYTDCLCNKFKSINICVSFAAITFLLIRCTIVPQLTTLPRVVAVYQLVGIYLNLN
jgi:hypothetical protein